MMELKLINIDVAQYEKEEEELKSFIGKYKSLLGYDGYTQECFLWDIIFKTKKYRLLNEFSFEAEKNYRKSPDQLIKRLHDIPDYKWLLSQFLKTVNETEILNIKIKFVTSDEGHLVIEYAEDGIVKNTASYSFKIQKRTDIDCCVLDYYHRLLQIPYQDSYSEYIQVELESN